MLRMKRITAPMAMVAAMPITMHGHTGADGKRVLLVMRIVMFMLIADDDDEDDDDDDDDDDDLSLIHI